MGEEGDLRGEYDAGGGDGGHASGRCGALVHADSAEGAAVAPSESSQWCVVMLEMVSNNSCDKKEEQRR